MKVNIYVNWGDQEVIRESEAEEYKEEKTEDFLDYHNSYDGREILESILEDFTSLELFGMTAEEKQAVEERFHRDCKDAADDWFDDNYDFIELEV